MLLWVVRCGEAAALVVAFQQAPAAEAAVGQVLVQRGVPADAARPVATLDDNGRPVVQLTLNADNQAALLRVIDGAVRAVTAVPIDAVGPGNRRVTLGRMNLFAAREHYGLSDEVSRLVAGAPIPGHQSSPPRITVRLSSIDERTRAMPDTTRSGDCYHTFRPATFSSRLQARRKQWWADRRLRRARTRVASVRLRDDIAYWRAHYPWIP